jgi:hypothetical protein
MRRLRTPVPTAPPCGVAVWPTCSRLHALLACRSHEYPASLQCSDTSPRELFLVKVETNPDWQPGRSVHQSVRVDEQDLIEVLDLQRVTREFLDHLMAMFQVEEAAELRRYCRLEASVSSSGASFGRAANAARCFAMSRSMSAKTALNSGEPRIVANTGS